MTRSRLCFSRARLAVTSVDGHQDPHSDDVHVHVRGDRPAESDTGTVRHGRSDRQGPTVGAQLAAGGRPQPDDHGRHFSAGQQLRRTSLVLTRARGLWKRETRDRRRS